MAFTTYGGLKTAIASWLARSDLTSDISDFVTLARQNIQDRLRLRGFECPVRIARGDTALRPPRTAAPRSPRDSTVPPRPGLPASGARPAHRRVATPG